MAITFNAERFIGDLIKELIKATEEVADIVYNETVANLSSEEARDSFTKDGIIYKELLGIANIIAYQFSGGANYIMDEFGTGSKMDITNPALDRYKKSELYNKARPSSNEIVTRGKGKYIDIYGIVRDGRGKAGIPIEDTPLGKRLLREPSHAFERATSKGTLTDDELREIVFKALNRLKFNRYFIIRPKTLKRSLWWM